MNHSPNKRWLRFSLRTVFVLMAFVCVLVACRVHQVKQQREAVAWIRDRGGEVYWISDNGRQFVRDRHGFDRGFGITCFDQPYLVHAVIRDADDIRALSHLTKLNKLALCVYNPVDLSQLGQLDRLEALAIEFEPGVGYSRLPGMRSLKWLGIDFRIAGDQEIQILQRLMPDCQIVDSQLPE